MTVTVKVQYVWLSLKGFLQHNWRNGPSHPQHPLRTADSAAPWDPVPTCGSLFPVHWKQASSRKRSFPICRGEMHFGFGTLDFWWDSFNFRDFYETPDIYIRVSNNRVDELKKKCKIQRQKVQNVLSILNPPQEPGENVIQNVQKVDDTYHGI